jgi:hypothetical protein
MTGLMTAVGSRKNRLKARFNLEGPCTVNGLSVKGDSGVEGITLLEGGYWDLAPRALLWWLLKCL